MIVVTFSASYLGFFTIEAWFLKMADEIVATVHNIDYARQALIWRIDASWPRLFFCWSL
jgi:hypothetical protein